MRLLWPARWRPTATTLSTTSKKFVGYGDVASDRPGLSTTTLTPNDVLQIDYTLLRLNPPRPPTTPIRFIALSGALVPPGAHLFSLELGDDSVLRTIAVTY